MADSTSIVNSLLGGVNTDWDTWFQQFDGQTQDEIVSAMAQLGQSGGGTNKDAVLSQSYANSVAQATTQLGNDMNTFWANYGSNANATDANSTSSNTSSTFFGSQNNNAAAAATTSATPQAAATSMGGLTGDLNFTGYDQNSLATTYGLDPNNTSTALLTKNGLTGSLGQVNPNTGFVDAGSALYNFNPIGSGSNAETPNALTSAGAPGQAMGFYGYSPDVFEGSGVPAATVGGITVSGGQQPRSFVRNPASNGYMEVMDTRTHGAGNPSSGSQSMGGNSY